MAAAASASGKVRSIAGVSLPCSASSLSASRSAWRVTATNITSRWRTNGDSTVARSCRPSRTSGLPPSPPTITSLPRGASTRRRSDSGRLPAQSTITS